MSVQRETVDGFDELVSKVTRGARNDPTKAVKWAVAIIVSIYGLYYALLLPYSNNLYTIVHLGTMLIVFGLSKIDEKDSILSTTANVAIILGSALATLYYQDIFVEMQSSRIVEGWRPLDFVFAAIVTIVLSVALWEEYGNILFGVIIATLIYTIYGSVFPGILQHSNFGIEQILGILVLDLGGAYGSLTRIAALWIFIFLIWAGLLREFGDIDAFLDIAIILGGRLKSGIFQIAIIGSMFFGMVTGAPASNIVVTGNFTIPLMKDRGIKAERAAAIETLGSLGGMVMPPIMGATAFIMALLTGRSYGQIIIFAFLPAILLYGVLIANVHFAVLRDLRNRSEDEQRRLLDMDLDRQVSRDDLIMKLLPVFASVAVLIYTLIGLRYGPTLAGIYTIAGHLVTKILVLGYFRELSASQFLHDSFTGLGQGSLLMAPLTIVLAGMMMVVALFQNTSLPLKIAINANQLAGGFLPIILLLVAIVVVLFGMGMPISASYLLGFTLMGPVMLRAGVHEMVTHFYIFYWATVAPLTPPVALGCAIAANVGDADFLGTVKEALQIGFAYFLLPFTFILFPDVILHQTLVGTVVAFVSIFGSLVVISLGLQWQFRTRLYNAVFIVAGVVLLYLTSTI